MGKAKKKKADPPCLTLSSVETLESLRQRFHISEEVELVLPSKSDRADNPSPNHFNLYESFFYQYLLWFPIPGLILRFLWKYGLAPAQITTRRIHHLVGIWFRSYECDMEIGVHHLKNLLEFRRSLTMNYLLHLQ